MKDIRLEEGNEQSEKIRKNEKVEGKRDAGKVKKVREGGRKERERRKIFRKGLVSMRG